MDIIEVALNAASLIAYLTGISRIATTFGRLSWKLQT
jgi:hypothetical protein